MQEIEDVINGEDVLLTKYEGEGIRGYPINDEKQRVKIPLNNSFWFSWAATHPATTVYK